MSASDLPVENTAEPIILVASFSADVSFCSIAGQW